MTYHETRGTLAGAEVILQGIFAGDQCIAVKVIGARDGKPDSWAYTARQREQVATILTAHRYGRPAAP